jgi:hypothetical protein
MKSISEKEGDLFSYSEKECDATETRTKNTRNYRKKNDFHVKL